MKQFDFEQCFIDQRHGYLVFEAITFAVVSISSISGTSRSTACSEITTSRSLYITKGTCRPPSDPQRWLICSKVSVYSSIVNFRSTTSSLVRSMLAPVTDDEVEKEFLLCKKRMMYERRFNANP